MSKHEPINTRCPVEKDNPCVYRFTNCISCGSCARACHEQAGVLGYYDLEKAGDTAVCIGCGQCTVECVGFPMQPRPSVYKVREAMAEGRVLIASVSPAVRVSIGEAFGMKEGELTEGKLCALLKALGFSCVLDTNTSADITIMEEASELLHRITNGGTFPMFTSCCPAWVRFSEIFFPELIPNLSSTKSPIAIQGATVKTWFAEKMGIAPNNITHVAITPCTAKKAEILRPELQVQGMQTTDIVVTARELHQWADEEDIDFLNLPEEHFDSLMGNASGAAAIFGKTGGVMEAALRTAYYMLNGENPPDDFLNFEPISGMDCIREAEADLRKAKINVAVIHGTANARTFIEKMKKDGKTYHFVEVMACPGGCIGGGGQPKPFAIRGCQPSNPRAASLMTKDENSPVRFSHENEEVMTIYREFYKAPLSEKAEKLLHTTYTDRSSLLG